MGNGPRNKKGEAGSLENSTLFAKCLIHPQTNATGLLISYYSSYGPENS